MVKKKKKRVQPGKPTAATGLPDKRLGNKWWECRSEHGRKKLFASAELLWIEALKYFVWVDEHPEYKSEKAMMDGMPCLQEVPVKQPYSIERLCYFLDCNSEYFGQFERALRAKGDNLSDSDKDFSRVIRNIRETIRANQIDGAMSGFFNANLTSRLNSLVDRSDLTSGDKPLPEVKLNVFNNAPPLAGDEKDIKD